MADDSEDTSGDSTDVFSSKFDPLKVFYADNVKLPDVDAPMFDNISKFESYCSKSLKPKTGGNDTQAGDEKRSTSRTLIRQDYPKPIYVGRKNNRPAKNIVNRMSKFLGPLSALYQYMENRIKIKVYTRNVTGVRGYIEAYVVAFDTHWNLALEDCFEVWTRKISRKSSNFGGAEKVTNAPQISCTSVVKKINKKMETVERHVPQLLLRGEQVILIVKIE